eukprot:COSAG05_NODE_42_length_26187_cov_393.972286_13_plen_290_part_00
MLRAARIASRRSPLCAAAPVRGYAVSCAGWRIRRATASYGQAGSEWRGRLVPRTLLGRTVPADAAKYAQRGTTGGFLALRNLLGFTAGSLLAQGERPGAHPSPPSHRPYASGRSRGCVRGGFGVFVAVGLVRHAPKGVGWVLLTHISRLTWRGFCCCCCCTGPRRRAVTAARAPGCVVRSAATEYQVWWAAVGAFESFGGVVGAVKCSYIFIILPPSLSSSVVAISVVAISLPLGLPAQLAPARTFLMRRQHRSAIPTQLARARLISLDPSATPHFNLSLSSSSTAFAS